MRFAAFGSLRDSSHGDPPSPGCWYVVASLQRWGKG